MTPRRLNPPHYFLAALLATLVLSWLPGPGLLPGPWRFVGIVFVVAGIALALMAARQFAAAGTNIVPLTPSSALVTRGAFACTRNPMYLGLVLTLLGVACTVNRPWPWVVLPVFVAVIQLRFVRHEERLMEATFGDAYTAYRSRVPRWLGYIKNF